NDVLPYVHEDADIKNKTLLALERQLKRSLPITNDLPALREIYFAHQNASLADLVLHRMGVLAFQLKQIGNAETYFKTLVNEYPSSEYYQSASNYLRSIQNTG